MARGRPRKTREETVQDRKARYVRIMAAYAELPDGPKNQTEIAKSLYPQIGQTAVSAWNGRTCPSPEHMQQIAEATGKSIEWIWLGRDNTSGEAQGLEELLSTVVDKLTPDARDRIRKKLAG